MHHTKLVIHFVHFTDLILLDIITSLVLENPVLVIQCATIGSGIHFCNFVTKKEKLLNPGANHQGTSSWAGSVQEFQPALCGTIVIKDGSSPEGVAQRTTKYCKQQ